MKTYYILVIGCQMNQADGERIDCYWQSLGLKKTAAVQTADLIILVTCGVRQTAEDRVYGLIPRVLADKPTAKIILTGCLAGRSDVRARLARYHQLSWLPITSLPSWGERLGLSATDQAGSLNYLSLPANYQSRASAYVPIGNGCDNFCAYCVVPYARGREVYRPHTEIAAEVKKLLAQGYQEITLIAQNVNSYRSPSEVHVGFKELLALLDDLDGEYWLRFATSHPKDMSEELIKTVARGRHTCQHFHLALQSGADEILQKMNRGYTSQHFLALVDLIRRISPDAAISTDIIVGFPGETDEQFQQTVKLMRAACFDQAFIAQYSPRPGTAAAQLTDDVPAVVKAERVALLTTILRQTARANHQKYLGRELEILVSAARKKNGQYFYSGKSATFQTVHFTTGQADLVGKLAFIKISQARDFGLAGDLIV